MSRFHVNHGEPGGLTTEFFPNVTHASRDMLSAVEVSKLCSSFAQRGRSDHWIATALGLDVNDVRRTLAARRNHA